MCLDSTVSQIHTTVMIQDRWPTLAEVEEEHIMTTLARCEYNIARTAAVLDISRSTLHRRLRELRKLIQGTTKPTAQQLAEARERA